jgi:hypothetical protein
MSSGMRLAIIAPFVAAAALAFTTPEAVAQPALTQPMSAPAGQHGEELSEGKALAWSLGGTVASYGAIALAFPLKSGELGTAGMLGTLIAPSFGHFYAGTWLTRGMGLRALGIVTLIVGAIADSEGCGGLFYSGHGDPVPEDCGDDFRTTKGTVLMLSGIGMFVGGTIDDIVTAPRRVRRHNDRIKALAVAPIVHGDGGGLVLSGRF